MFNSDLAEKHIKNEKSVLGTIIKNGRFELIKRIDSEVFLSPQNEFIFLIMDSLYSKGELVNPENVIHELKIRGIVEEGEKYVKHLLRHELNHAELKHLIKDM